MLYKTRCTLYSLLFFLVLALPVHGGSLDQNCQILVTLSDNEIAILASTESGYEEVARLAGTVYWAAPNQRYIAVQQVESNGLGNSVAIYDLSSGVPIEKWIIPGVAFIRGAVWSPDSRFLLLQDAQNNFLLYLYNLNSEMLEPIFRTFDPGLAVYQGVWNDTGNLIAFVARETPFPETKYANVTALYVLDLATNAYYPVSSPDEEVGYYFENFYWVRDDEIAFTSCLIDDSDCQIKIANLKGGIRAEFDGDYWLTGYDRDNLLLAVDRSSLNEGTGDANLVTIDVRQQKLTTLFQLPIDPSTPIPTYSMAPDFSYISYVNDTGQIVIVELGDSTSYDIGMVANYDSGTWGPEDYQLLFQSDSNLYIYDAEQRQSQPIFSVPHQDRLNSLGWLCISGQQ